MTETPTDPILAALVACSAALLKHAADALAAGDKALADRTYSLRSYVERIAADHAGTAPIRKPRARKEG